jgi:hypothetical protein
LFAGVSTKLIQDCYNVLKDPLVINNILTIAMPKNQKKDYSSTNPNLCKESSSERYARVMANLIFNNNNKKTITQQLVLKGSGLPQA